MMTTGVQENYPGGRVRLMSFLLAVTLPLALLAFDTWRVLFNPPLIKALMTEEVLDSGLVPAALEWYSERRAKERVAQEIALTGVDEPDIVLLLSFMEAEDWAEVKDLLLTEQFQADQVSVTVDGFYAWIDSEEVVPEILLAHGRPKNWPCRAGDRLQQLAGLHPGGGQGLQ